MPQCCSLTPSEELLQLLPPRWRPTGLQGGLGWSQDTASFFCLPFQCASLTVCSPVQASCFSFLLSSCSVRIVFLAHSFFSAVPLHSFWASGETVLMHLLSRVSYMESWREVLYRLLRLWQSGTWRLPQTITTGTSKAISHFWRWKLRFCSLMSRICWGCSSPAKAWLSTFILLPILPPSSFLCLLRLCKCFTTLTQILPHIYKGLWPSAVVNHSLWSNLSFSACSSFITLPLPANDLPRAHRALTVSCTAHLQSCSVLDSPDFLVSHSDLLVLCYISTCSSSSVRQVLGWIRKALDMNYAARKWKVGGRSCRWRSVDYRCWFLGMYILSLNTALTATITGTWAGSPQHLHLKLVLRPQSGHLWTKS